MTAFEWFDLLTIGVVATVWVVVSYAMLLHVVFWTGLGRSLFAFFATTSVSAIVGTAWRLATTDLPPRWVSFGIRLPVVLAGIGVLYFLWKYPWPFRSHGIRWKNLLGLERDQP